MIFKLFQLRDVQEYYNYKRGWVWFRLQAEFGDFSFQEFTLIGDTLGYHHRWALHQWGDQQGKQHPFEPEPARTPKSTPAPAPNPPRHPLQSCLDLLGIKPPFTIADLKKAYRHLSLLTHPDTGGNQESFLNVTAAYEALKPWAEGAA